MALFPVSNQDHCHFLKQIGSITFIWGMEVTMENVAHGTNL